MQSLWFIEKHALGSFRWQQSVLKRAGIFKDIITIKGKPIALDWKHKKVPLA